MEALTVDRVSMSFFNETGPTPVLNDVTFSVVTQEIVALFGPNGCGKSTLFAILAGLEDAYAGKVSINAKSPQDANVGYVFQNFDASLFPWLTLSENIQFSRKLRANSAPPLLPDHPAALLARLDLENFQAYFPYQVSGGMKQRVCFLRALATSQELLLLDEPFSALDVKGFSQLLQTFEALSDAPRPPTLLICHDLDQAMAFSDRVLVLSPRPASVVEDISLPFQRPRQPELILDVHFQAIRKKIMEVRLRLERGA